MEQGLLPPAGVSDRVLDALGRIVGETAQALRDAGRALTPAGEGPRPRRRPRSRAAPTPSQPAPRRAGTQPPPTAEWDEVDELFRGA